MSYILCPLFLSVPSSCPLSKEKNEINRQKCQHLMKNAEVSVVTDIFKMHDKYDSVLWELLKSNLCNNIKQNEVFDRFKIVNIIVTKYAYNWVITLISLWLQSLQQSSVPWCVQYLHTTEEECMFRLNDVSAPGQLPFCQNLAPFKIQLWNYVVDKYILCSDRVKKLCWVFWKQIWRWIYTCIGVRLYMAIHPY
jgi:hypothetical protein